MNPQNNPKEICVVNFSNAVTQEDVVDNESINYYSSNKGILLSYLSNRFPDIHLKLIGLSKNTSFNRKCIEKLEFVRLPSAGSLNFASIIFNVLVFIYLVLNPRPSLIIIFSMREVIPYASSFIYSKVYGVPIFFSLRNPPMSYCPFRNPSFFKRQFQRCVDEMAFILSKRIIHTSNKSKDLLKQSPKFYQKSLVMDSSPNQFILKYIKKGVKRDDKLIAYWGSLDKLREIEIMINGFAMARRLSNEFDLKLLIIGGGTESERIKLLNKKIGESVMKLIGYVNQRELYNILSNVGGAIIPIPSKEVFNFFSITKLAEAVILEIPVIATNIEPNHMVSKYNIGILCDHSVGGYAEAFLKFWRFSEFEKQVFRQNCKKIQHLFMPEILYKSVGDEIEGELNSKMTP